jgi:hypothetical protein
MLSELMHTIYSKRHSLQGGVMYKMRLTQESEAFEEKKVRILCLNILYRAHIYTYHAQKI